METKIPYSMVKRSAALGDLTDLNLKGELNSIRTIQFADDTIIFSAEEDMLARRLHRAAFNLGLQELAKKSAPDASGDNFLADL
ncbi:uncharacterized protein LOC109827353 isoform X3 [Asparagus officinalis]|uniref:uncharacterized protein LOC109827353 isoform X3 n=1 Tax=Asparagus officinalis TaxID=4686 RepID=UPI00098E32EF|nr:uncharacterized protein LOC109827353 isoform X3 [Asparagus officinalis]